jgi:hypothetical protein
MNSPFDRNAGDAPLASSLPLSLLALVELAQLKRDYAQYLQASPEEDRWFVMRGTEALPPMSFHEVLHRLARGEGPLAVLREAEAELDPTPWQTLDYRASASNRATVLAAAIGFWVVAVFLGWVVVAVLVPAVQTPIWECAYIVAALVLVAALSLPAGLWAKLRGRQF